MFSEAFVCSLGGGGCKGGHGRQCFQKHLSVDRGYDVTSCLVPSSFWASPSGEGMDKQITGTFQYLLTVREGNVFRSVCLFTGVRVQGGAMEGNVFRSVCLLTGSMMSLPVWYHVPSRGHDVTACLVPYSFQGV